MESSPNAKEIEMGTMAESLELRFRLYLPFYLLHSATAERDELFSDQKGLLNNPGLANGGIQGGP